MERTVNIQFDLQGSIAGFKDAITSILTNESVKGLLILSCDGNRFSPSEINVVLQQVQVPVIGGIFPQIIYKNKNYERGTIIMGLLERPEVHLIPKLDGTESSYVEVLDGLVQDISQTKTMMVFVDGLSSWIGELIQSLFVVFGLEVNYLGGGAGSLSFEQKPCLFTNQGLLMDHAVLALLPLQSGIGVQHGWESISGPYKVTEAEGNVIKSLDWLPAFDVYKQVVEKVSNRKFKDDNFFDISKGFPFGIKKMGAEIVVRDPIVVQEDGALVCVGDVSDDSFVNILQGNVASLVNAAQQAMLNGLAAFPDPDIPATHIFIDCISRVLYLEDQFQQELDAVYNGNAPLIGALTLGEIANTGKDYLEFYNKTAVVGVLQNQ